MLPIKQIRFTKEGHEKLKKDYENLFLERKLAVEDLQKARSMGDLSENGYYKAARFKLSTVDRNLRLFSNFLKQAIIMDHASFGFVDINSKVTLLSEKGETTYEIVGDLEANPNKNKISLLSPLGRAIKDKREGDEVTMNTPSGEISYSITKIS